MMQPATAHADGYSYTTWNPGITNGGTTVSGTLLNGTVTVTYTGDVTWFNTAVGPTTYAPSTDFTSATVSNAPPNTGMIGLSRDTIDTLTFSSPISNPVLDVVSLGGGGMTTNYTFSAGEVPIILSQGTDIWGGSSSALKVSGNTLYASEGTGAVEFAGTYSSISWTATDQEYWNGITVAADTPEPNSLILLGSGLLCLALVVFRSAKPARFSVNL
jgi:hypothetical protein